MGRQPEPRRGRGAALLPERRRAAGGARVRVPHGQPRARRGCVRGGCCCRRPCVRGARRRRRGGRGCKAHDREARRSGTRARRGAARPELHGLLRARRGGCLERASAGHDGARPRRRSLPVRIDRRRVSLTRGPGRDCAASSPPERRRSPMRLDFLDFFADDDGTRAVGLFLETVRRPDAFVDALRRCAEADKPVVCLKVGRSEAAARAALSHTGALVGSNRAFSAVLRRYSAIEVDDFHELVETLEILGRQRRPARSASRRDLRVRRRVRTPRRPGGGSRNPLRAAVGRPRGATHQRVSELPRSRKSPRRLGHRRRDRGLPAVARAPRRVRRVRHPGRAGGPLAVSRPYERRVVRADAANTRAARRRTQTGSSAR